MRTSINTTVLAALLTVLSPPLLAQWPRYPTAGVPRTADGKPDLNAPTPRTADGKPDLSGNWENRGGFGRDAKPPVERAGVPPLAMFWNAGAGFTGGLPLQPWASDLLKKRTADQSKDNPDALCLPMGFLQFHTHPQPRKIIQTPGLIVIIYEANYGLRYIYTDGRPLPNNDPTPWWYGYSIGTWDGDTLVVETTGFRDDGWLDVNGSPYTNALKLTERFRRPDFATLDVEITVRDEKAYTRPWTVRVNQRIMVDAELIEFICLENQQFLKRVNIP